MASITHKIYLDKSLVIMRVTYQRRHAYIGTDVRISNSKLFNPEGNAEKRNWVRSGHPQSVLLNTTINNFHDRLLEAKKHFTAPGAPAFTVEDVKTRIDNPHDAGSFSAYLEEVIALKRARNQFGTIWMLTTLLVDLRAFLKLDKDGSILFSALRPEVITAFETYLLTKPLRYNRPTTTAKRRNSVSQLLSQLRGFLGRYMRERRISPERHPMSGLKLPVLPSDGTLLTAAQIDYLIAFELPKELPAITRRTLAEVRDLFVCAYGLHGIRVGDLITARCGQVIHDPLTDRVEFRYVSTKRKLIKYILAEGPFRAKLLERIAGRADEDFLFGFVNADYYNRLTPEKQYYYIRSRTGEANRYLKKLAQEAGLPYQDLRLHSSRHSFAEELLEATGGDLQTTQYALGHTMISTTQRYAKGRARRQVDRANVVYARYSTETVPKQISDSGETDSLDKGPDGH